MKVLRFCAIIAITLFFASCRPNGSAMDHDIMKGTPSNADTVLPRKFHVKGDTIQHHEEKEFPSTLKR